VGVNELQHLKNNSVRVTPSDPSLDDGSVLVAFCNGTILRVDYWRLIKEGRASVSSFDHKQKYGLPSPIDTIDFLENELQGQFVAGAQLEKETGDLLFDFTNGIRLQAFNFTGYEVWDISFRTGQENFQTMPNRREQLLSIPQKKAFRLQPLLAGEKCSRG
jgi:hypothetical protein